MAYIIIAIVMAVLTFGGDEGLSNFVIFTIVIGIFVSIFVWMDNRELEEFEKEIKEEARRKKQQEQK